MNCVIEKSFPIPPPAKIGAPKKYPLSDMEVGDSFFVKDVSGKRNPAYSSVCNYGKESGKKFTVRRSGGGVRVWRIA
jgi:hypothetical protein